MGGMKMPYKEVSLATKMDVVKDCFSGEKVTHIAQKYNVSRESVYTWKDAALEAMENALQSYQTNQANLLKNKLKNMEEKYQKLSDDYKRLTQKTQLSVSSTQSNEIRPTRCPDCSGNHIIKNGSYETQKGINQRFRCRDCNKRIFIVKKNSN